jgi:hypothetical protein
MITYVEKEMSWKGVTVAYLNLLPQHAPGRTKGKQKILGKDNQS